MTGNDRSSSVLLYYISSADLDLMIDEIGSGELTILILVRDNMAWSFNFRVVSNFRY